MSFIAVRSFVMGVSWKFREDVLYVIHGVDAEVMPETNVTSVARSYESHEGTDWIGAN